MALSNLEPNPNEVAEPSRAGVGNVGDGNDEGSTFPSRVDYLSTNHFTEQQDLLGTVSSKQRKTNNQTQMAIYQCAEFLGGGNWAGSSFRGISSDRLNHASQEINHLENSAEDITFDFDIQENGSLKVTREKANSKGKIIETLDYFGFILTGGNFVLVSRSNNETALGRIAQ